MGVVLDEYNNEIFVNDHRSSKIFVYDLHGKFKRILKHKEGAIYNPVFNFDQHNLICLDFHSDFEEEPENRFFIISKQDGSVTKELQIPIKEKESTTLTLTKEGVGVIGTGARNQELIPYDDTWILVEPSSDTIYRIQPDYSMLPFIVRTPSIHSMDPEVFLFPGVLTDRYYFMQAVKKEYDFDTRIGFPRTDLMYDKQEKALFEYRVYNDDFSNKRTVNLVYEDITILNGSEIAFIQKLDAYDLVEAYKNGQLKGKLKEIAATLEEESNPVIMIAKYKK